MAELGKKKMSRHERPSHLRFIQKKSNTRGNPDMLAYMGNDIDMNEIGKQAKEAAVETAKREEEERQLRAELEAKLRALEAEDEEY